MKDIVMKVKSQSIVESRRKQFKRMFVDKYSLKLLGLQVWDNKDGRILGEVSFAFGNRLTALRIQAICEEVAEWLGGELFGTVNLDFAGTIPSLEMMVELYDEVK